MGLTILGMTESIFDPTPSDEFGQSYRVVGERVMILLKRKRMTQTELGLALGKHQTAISKKLSGQSPWTLDELIEVSVLLDFPLAKLVEDADAARRAGEEAARLQGFEPRTFCSVVFGPLRLVKGGLTEESRPAEPGTRRLSAVS